SGINNTFRQVGIATGIAALGAIFTARVESDTTAKLEGAGMPSQKAGAVAHSIANQRAGGGGGGAPAVAHAAHVAFINALNEILLVGALVAFTGAVLGLLLVRSDDFAHGPEPAADERMAEPVAAG